MGIIVTKPGSVGSAGSGVFSQAEKLALELEMEFKAAKLYYYKEFTYIGSQLTGVDVYEDNTKVVQLFNKILTYTESKLTRTDLTRISDSVVLTKTFSYVDNKLISITTT
jgi:hypothetical protein